MGKHAHTFPTTIVQKKQNDCKLLLVPVFLIFMWARFPIDVLAAEETIIRNNGRNYQPVVLKYFKRGVDSAPLLSPRLTGEIMKFGQTLGFANFKIICFKRGLDWKRKVGAVFLGRGRYYGEGYGKSSMSELRYYKFTDYR